MDIIDAARNINKTHEHDILARLTTIWGENLDPKHVLDEYPRPQLRRNNYTILNGYWNYAITKSASSPSVYDGQILVPFSPESILSGVERQLKPDEYLWYERTLPIASKEYRSLYTAVSSPADQVSAANFNSASRNSSSSQRLILHLGTVDQIAAVYLNGLEVCSHIGGYLPFEADITAFIKEGDNSLSLRVQDFSDASYHSRGKQTLKRGGMFYTAQSGIWQTVWMEWVPQTYIQKLYLTPDYDNAQIAIRLIISSKISAPLKAEVYADERCIYQSSHKTVRGCRHFSLRAPLCELHSWTPETPFLYKLRLQYGDDLVESYFALRCFTVEPDGKGMMRFCLNHKPYFLHGVLDQGYWSDGLYTAPSDEALIYDISAMKKLGFNMMRKHIKIESARWYYHCDRMGMIVWQDMVSGGSHYSLPLVCYFPTLFPTLSGWLRDDHYKLFGRSLRKGREEWIKECIDTVDYLYNVPSLAVWVPFNEGWGQFDANKITKKIKEKDSARLVDHASGWFDQKGGDFKSVHNYFSKLKIVRDPRAFVLSEYGGFACRIKDHSSVERIFGYHKFDTRQSLTNAFRVLTAKEVFPLIKDGLSAAVYTQVSDVEEEVNGLLTYDRKLCKIADYNRQAPPSIRS